MGRKGHLSAYCPSRRQVRELEGETESEAMEERLLASSWGLARSDPPTSLPTVDQADEAFFQLRFLLPRWMTLVCQTDHKKKKKKKIGTKGFTQNPSLPIRHLNIKHGGATLSDTR